MSFPFPFKFEREGQEVVKPEEVIGALTQVPPRLSVLQRIPAAPETMFRTAVKEATGIEIMPGPNEMMVRMMESFEAAVPAPPAGRPEKKPKEAGALPKREMPTVGEVRLKRA